MNGGYEMRITNQRFGREFWALWKATALSNLGDGLFKFALPLLAAKLTNSPALVASVSLALTLPWLLFALPVGVIVDRLDRKRIMVVVNLIRTAAVGSLAFAQQLDWLSVFVLGFLAFLVGTCETVSDTTSGALVPSVVNRDQLEQANARIYSVETIMNKFIGGPLGGYLLAISLLLPAVGSAVSFLAAAVALLLMRGHFSVERKQSASIWREVSEGVRFLWTNQLLRTLAIMVAIMASCWSAFFSILVLYAVAPGPLGLQEYQYGLLLTSLAAGSVAGSLLVSPLQRLFGRGALLGLDIIGTFAMLFVPGVWANVWLVGAAMFLAGMGGTTWVVAVNSIRQRVVPNELLGRVYGAYRLISWGTLPIGAFLAGIVAELAGLQVVFLGGAILNLFLVFPLISVLREEKRQMEQSGGSVSSPNLVP